MSLRNNPVEKKEEDDIPPNLLLKSTPFPALWRDETIQAIDQDLILGRTSEAKLQVASISSIADPNTYVTVQCDKGIEVVLPNKEIAIVSKTKVQFYSCEKQQTLNEILIPFVDPAEGSKFTYLAAKLSANHEYLMVLVHENTNPEGELERKIHTHVFLLDVKNKTLAAKMKTGTPLSDIAMAGKAQLAAASHLGHGLTIHDIDFVTQTCQAIPREIFFKGIKISQLDTTPDFEFWVTRSRPSEKALNAEEDENLDSSDEFDSDIPDELKVTRVKRNGDDDKITIATTRVGEVDETFRAIVLKNSVVYLQSNENYKDLSSNLCEINCDTLEKEPRFNLPNLALKNDRHARLPGLGLCLLLKDDDQKYHLNLYLLRSSLMHPTSEMRRPYVDAVQKGFINNVDLPVPLAELIVKYAWSRRWGLATLPKPIEDVKNQENANAPKMS